MVFCPGSRESCDYYNVDFDTKKPLTDEQIERKRSDEEYINKSSLIPRPNSNVPTDYYPQQSRDYALANTIRCGCTVCPANANGYCGTPALIVISSGGQCVVGRSFVENLNPKVESATTTTLANKKKNKFTPQSFWDLYNCNCPQLDDRELKQYKERIPGSEFAENWDTDVIRINERARKKKG